MAGNRNKNKKAQNLGIQSVDLLGDHFKIGYSTITSRFQSKLGGYLTILMGVLSTSMFFIVMSQFFTKNSPVVMTSAEFGSKIATFNIYRENLYLVFALAIGPLRLDGSQIGRYATIKAEVVDVVDNFTTRMLETTPYRDFDFEICKFTTDKHILDHVKEVSPVPEFVNFLICPDFRGLGDDFVVYDNYENYTHKWVSIKVYPCSLEDKSRCAPVEEIARLRADYGYPLKILQPSEAEEPVKSAPVRRGTEIDPRSTKVVKEIVKLNRVLDGTLTTLIPPRIKEEYATLEEYSIDPKMRNSSQVYCTKEQIRKGPAGGCQEYISFDYFASSEVVVTLRSYKKLTTMLGEYGGLLKIMTTLMFFFYGIYSVRKVKSVLRGLIFGSEEGSDKVLKNLVDGGNPSEKSFPRANQVSGKRVITQSQSREGENFEALVSRFVGRRSNVDNLIHKLNLLEVIEKAFFTDDEKTLVPLVLLKSELSEIKNKKRQQKREILGEVQIFAKESKLQKNGQNSILSKTSGSSQAEKLERKYKTAFENILNKNPGSAFSRVIQDFIISNLKETFPESKHDINKQPSQNPGEKGLLPGPNNQLKKCRLQKIQAFNEKIIEKEVEEEEEEYEKESPQNQIIGLRKKSGGTGFMRPINSPMRIRRKPQNTNQGAFTLLNASRSSINLGRKITPPEGQQKEESRQ